MHMATPFSGLYRSWSKNIYFFFVCACANSYFFSFLCNAYFFVFLCRVHIFSDFYALCIFLFVYVHFRKFHFYVFAYFFILCKKNLNLHTFQWWVHKSWSFYANFQFLCILSVFYAGCIEIFAGENMDVSKPKPIYSAGWHSHVHRCMEKKA